MATRRNRENEDPRVTFILDKFSKRLKALRVEMGISNYEKFANKLNLSRSQMGRYEKGEDIKFSTIVKIAMELGMPLSELFKDFDAFE